MSSNIYLDKISKILRISKKSLENMTMGLEKVTGRPGIPEKIFFENEKLTEEKLRELGVSHETPALEVYDALISRVEADDLKLLGLVGCSSLRGFDAARAVIDFVKKNHKPGGGLFLKKEKAKQLLIAEPPKKIMAALGYDHVGDLVEKEDWLEIYSALRFLEDSEWQNKIFFKQYESLRPEDFEERQIELKALSERWSQAAEKFVVKKHHNISHLKELGVVFVIPLFLGISGETLRALSLLFHYLHEIRYYSDLFKTFAHNPRSFSKNLISTLRGDVIEKRPPPMALEVQRPTFLVVQRYLAKDDENDWRLFEPHINPEALHWQRAIEDIVKINHGAFKFWDGIGWVGDFFKTEVGVDVLVSFDLVDTVMSLVKQKELAKYLYHHQEALWNKIFAEYFSLEKLEKLSKEHIVRGWFEV